MRLNYIPGPESFYFKTGSEVFRPDSNLWFTWLSLPGGSVTGLGLMDRRAGPSLMDRGWGWA